MQLGPPDETDLQGIFSRPDGEPLVPIGWDTETELIAPGRLAPTIVCVSWAARGLNGHLRTWLGKRPGSRHTLISVIRNPDILNVVHNAAFDFAAAWATWGEPFRDAAFEAYDEGRVQCTRIREQLRLIAAGAYNAYKVPSASLGDTVERLLGEHVEGKEGPDVWRLRYAELDDVPLDEWPKAAVDYARKDAAYHLRVFEAQGGLTDDTWQARYAFALHLLAARGFRADGAATRDYRAKLEAKVNAACEQLVPLGLKTQHRDGSYSGRGCLQTVRDMVEARYTELGREVPRTAIKIKDDGTTSGGNVQYGGDQLEALPCVGEPCDPERDHVCDEPLHLLASIGEDTGELSKYVKWLERAVEYPVNAYHNPLVATGRTSVSKPPYQQFPRRDGIRECIIPREGWLFAGADYGKAELVAWAQIAIDMFGSCEMADRLASGIDLHTDLAAEIEGVPYATMQRWLDGAEGKERKAYAKRLRNCGKAGNFGLLGGLGVDSFVDYAWKTYRVKLERDFAAQIIRVWKGKNPTAVRYLRLVGEWVDEGGGRFDLIQPKSGRVRGAVGYTNGCNSPFQGLVADCAKRALWRVTRECWLQDPYPPQAPDRPPRDLGPAELADSLAGAVSPLYGCRPSFFIHDEIILEAPETQAAAAAERLAYVMCAAFREFVTDVPIEADPYLMARWYKNAETVRASDGTLLRWEPAE